MEQPTHTMDDSEACSWCGNFRCCIDAELNGGLRTNDARLFCGTGCRDAYYAVDMSAYDEDALAG